MLDYMVPAAKNIWPDFTANYHFMPLFKISGKDREHIETWIHAFLKKGSINQTIIAGKIGFVPFTKMLNEENDSNLSWNLVQILLPMFKIWIGGGGFFILPSLCPKGRLCWAKLPIGERACFPWKIAFEIQFF